MGNVCGCVRAEKEDKYLDPAKTPLSPEKYSPGRNYFRRKPIKNTVGDTEPVEPNYEDESKTSSIQLSEAQPALLSRGLVREESVTPDLTLENGTIQQERTEVVVDCVKQRLLPTAASRCSYRGNLAPANDSEAEVKVSELDGRISTEDSTPYCAKRKKRLDDANAREITFQRKTDVFSLQKAASVSSVYYGTERSLEKSGFSEDPSKNYGSVQEKQKTERFCPYAIQHFHFEKKRCHSLCANMSSTSKDTDRNKVSEVWSLSGRC